MAQCKKSFDEESCKNSEEDVRQVRLEAGTRAASAASLGDVEKMEALEKDVKLKEMIGKEKARLVAAKACGEQAECWRSKLKDPSPKVRDKAAYELSYLKDKASKEALVGALREDDLEARFAVFLALLRLQTGGAEGGVADAVAKILDDETGKMQFIKINEDLKRLEVKARRGY
jgi:HEAT repeat protein